MFSVICSLFFHASCDSFLKVVQRDYVTANSELEGTWREETPPGSTEESHEMSQSNHEKPK